MTTRPQHKKYPSFLLFRGPPIKNADKKRRFDPPAEQVHPFDVFEPAMNRCPIPEARYIRQSDRYSVLVSIAGALVPDDGSNLRASFCVVFGPGDGGQGGPIWKGRADANEEQSTDRAELRAALASLDTYIWWGEGFGKVVIATSSEFLVKGVCENLSAWKAVGWRDSKNDPIPNGDLWEKLLQKIEEYEGYGVSVQLWLVDPVFNEVAASGALQGAGLEEDAA